jgi:hypothetical protein
MGSFNRHAAHLPGGGDDVAGHGAPVTIFSNKGTEWTRTMDLTGTSAAPRSSSAATGPAGRTGRLATWLAGTTLEDVPPPVHEHAKHLILDGIACAFGRRAAARVPRRRAGDHGTGRRWHRRPDRLGGRNTSASAPVL